MARNCRLSYQWSFTFCVLLSVLQLHVQLVRSQSFATSPVNQGSQLYGKQLGDVLQSHNPQCIANGQQDYKDTFEFADGDPSPQVCKATRTSTGGTINRLDGAPRDQTGQKAGRLCTKGELELFFNRPNPAAPLDRSDNCDPNNLALWGCLPGFASWTVDPTPIDSDKEPARGDYTTDPSAADLDLMACCEGFFCPQNLACMIPCPEGAYCPKAADPAATTSKGRALCPPYNYQALITDTVLKCGGAHTWNVASGAPVGDGIFCNEGAYCPFASGPTGGLSGLNVCAEGSYCRKGSTEAKPCSGLASCGVGESKQNLKGAGIGFVVFLLVVLAVTYYLVDYVTDHRQEQVEKRREQAESAARARQVAKERWQRAGRKIITAIRKQNKLQGRTGPRPTSRQGQDLYGQPATSGNDLYGGPPAPGVYGAPADGISAAGDLYGASSGGDLYGAAPAPAQVEMAKRGAKFNYEDVYAELARQNKKGTVEDTLVGSILSGGALGAKKIRVQLELEFRDVNLFLKSNGRKLLDNISGVLRPGRVTAVMGPSGAGKSMFLTAVAGKETYCNMTGQVLINGQAGNIQAYKRIIGFVPQDDIVHGNLTVEENLWFSANYRLPRSMGKRSKVLIVERTLISLGIDHIRHSRVGTVEQRGISGGQRKRVNVGLEMVIDPSLLILDEPTSGLDSTSSFKVLQALRQEAARGVNIGVVLHQPSYKLFHMFHDVMFLMPGGKVVYLGPVKQAEEYFASLGFPVPDRVNPPDHYMDVLGGEVQSEKGIATKSLPELWLQTQGHSKPPSDYYSNSNKNHVEIPMGDQVSILNHDTYKKIKGPSVLGVETLTRKLARDFKAKLVRKREDLAEIFQKKENHSGRVTPGFLRQFRTIGARLAKQQFRSTRILFQDYVILLITGAALGLLTPTQDSQLGGASAYTNTIIAVSLLGMIAGLRTFSQDTLNFYRESASGINKLAYFIAKDLSDFPHILLKPVFYMALFYFFNDPRSTFVSNFGLTVCLVYCVTGVAYVLACLMPPSSSQLAAAVVTLVASVISTKVKPVGITKVFYALSFARWAQEAYVLANAKRYSGVWLLTRCGVLAKAGYDVRDYGLCIFMLIFFGLLARWGAFMLLIGLHRDKQK